jgi:hypothetical protein
MNMQAAAEADAIAAEILTPRMKQKVCEAIMAMEGGHDKELVLHVLVGFAYMEGMLAMSKVGFPQ